MSKQAKGRNFVLFIGIVLALLLVGSSWLCWNHIRFWYLFEGLGKNEQGYPEYRHRQTEIIFVRLPGGTFTMGSSTEEKKRFFPRSKRWADSRHKVTLSSFLIAKYEVSQEEWRRVMGNNPSRFKGANLPVDRLSWYDCQEFCKKADLSLPTEAQWESACRAGTATAFAFGDSLTKNQANFGRPTESVSRGVQRTLTEPVTSYRPNAFGIYNMHGNVKEWCRDFVPPKNDFWSTPEARKPDPVCTAPSKCRAVRGGAFDNSVGYCRSACPPGLDPDARKPGMRPVFNLYQ